MANDDQTQSAVVLDEQITFTLYELSATCRISTEMLLEMVEEGILEPFGKQPQEWIFCGLDVRRIQTVVRLQRDLRVNLPGAALALHLLDEIEKLRTR
jgi:chaperone modulatory protein CbpM